MTHGIPVITADGVVITVMATATATVTRITEVIMAGDTHTTEADMAGIIIIR